MPSPLGSTLPSAIVMSMVIVDGVADARFAPDPPPLGDGVPPLKIRLSGSTPQQKCRADETPSNPTDIQDHNGG
jgi:hypothetical protein